LPAASFDDPINIAINPAAARVVPVGLPNVGGDTVVALAFSGGGTALWMAGRAAPALVDPTTVIAGLSRQSGAR
jgi:hypothetical protein